MAKLSAAARRNLPKNQFALPGGGPKGADAYPIQDRRHAANALSRVAANGTPAEKAEVRRKVAAKYPDLPSSQGKGKSQAASTTKRTARRAGRSK